jgi:8-oxo-dGTP diphosphatase
MSKPLIEVAAGLLQRPDGMLLLAQRPADKPWPGWWELPGGKIEPGETTLDALSRELREELGIEVTASAPWVTHTHEYPKNIVRLAFCRVTGWHGEPRGVEGQTLAWVDPLAPLQVSPLLPATEPPLRWLRLPDRYLISSIGGDAGLPAFLDKLERALAQGMRLVQFREPQWDEAQAHRGLARVLSACHAHGARCLLNSCHPEAWRAEADGVHWRAADARRQAAMAAAAEKHEAPVEAKASGTAQETGQPPRQAHAAPDSARRLVAVSAHDADDLAAARALEADFAVLGHVLDTPSHPGVPGMGWARFSQLRETAGLPVFAIGGQSAGTMADALRHGAHGIAGIRYLASPEEA